MAGFQASQWICTSGCWHLQESQLRKQVFAEASWQKLSKIVFFSPNILLDFASGSRQQQCRPTWHEQHSWEEATPAFLALHRDTLLSERALKIQNTCQLCQIRRWVFAVFDVLASLKDFSLPDHLIHSPPTTPRLSLLTTWHVRISVPTPQLHLLPDNSETLNPYKKASWTFGRTA